MVADHVIGLLEPDRRLHFLEDDPRGSPKEPHKRVAVLGRELELDENLVRCDVARGVLHKEVAEPIQDLGDTHLSERCPK